MQGHVDGDIKVGDLEENEEEGNRRDTEQHTGGNRREVQERRHMKRHWGEFRQRRGEKYGKG